MKFFRNASLQRKQTLIIMLTAGIALLLVCAAFAVYEVLNFRKGMVRDLSTLAEVIGNNSAAALDFNDAKAAEEIIAALRAEPHIVAACLYSREGKPFVKYRRADTPAFTPPATKPEGSYFDRDHLSIFRQIEQKGEVSGIIYLESDLQALTERLRQYALIAVAVLATALVLAFLISARLQRLISEPILQLVGTTRAVAEKRDYSLRVTHDLHDEIGVLINGFNEMLAQIQSRDLALQKSHDELEQRVADRTLDLRNTNEKLAQAHRELAESLALLRATLESTADGLLVVNREKTAVIFNQRFVEMWGVPDAIATTPDAQKLLEFMTTQTGAEEFARQLQNPSSTIAANEFDVIKFSDDRIFECYSHPQTIAERVVGTVWSFRDITRRVALEDQLRQAQKMECVGQLAGGIAHDFNNIMTIIQGHAALLAETVTEPDTLSVQEISGAAARAANLTRQLLAFSRRQVMAPNPLSPAKVISNISRMLCRLIGEDIRLEFSFSPGLPLIKADIGMFEQILMNLAVNSRDAMPKGGIFKIHATSVLIDDAQAAQSPDAAAGEFVCMEISDTGCGIAPQHLRHIFEPFFTTKDVGKGSGLGLATVYGIVKQHGGWITVQSRPGEGTTFKIYFPAMPAEQHPKPVAPALPEKIVGGHETILMVEDDPSVRSLTARILKDLGYQIVQAESGVHALEVEQRFAGEIHLLLTDLVMPDGLSGQELASRIQRLRSGIKTVFVSGYSQEFFAGENPLPEGVCFLRKPFNREELAKTIRKSLCGEVSAN